MYTIEFTYKLIGFIKKVLAMFSEYFGKLIIPNISSIEADLLKLSEYF